MKKFFVIGNPIEHSLSPKLHNYWIKSNKLKAVYDKKKLDVSELENLIKEVKPKWHENKYLWFFGGILITSGSVYLAGQIK